MHGLLIDVNAWSGHYYDQVHGLNLKIGGLVATRAGFTVCHSGGASGPVGPVLTGSLLRIPNL